jgi:hypothetical protein
MMKIKNKNRSFFILAFIPAFFVFFTSCEKVIDVDLNSSSPAIVIEGSISDQPGPHVVKISKTVNFDESNIFPAVTGALVTLSDDIGNAEVLAEVSPGVYHSTTLAGIPGRTYTLKVIDDGKEYTATSTMYLPVPIDTLTISSFGFGNSENKIINLKFNDPAGIENFYRVIQIINGDTLSSISVDSDLLLDGELITYPVFVEDIESGDSVRMVLQSIDENVLIYLRLLNQLSGNGDQSASPANPPSNFSNSALGYFSAHAETSKLIVIP